TSFSFVGTNTITAVYSGDSNFSASTSAAITQTVNKDNTSTTVTSSVNPSVFGQAVTFTAAVSVTSPGSGSPSGSVTFFDGAAPLGTAALDASSKATLSVSSLAVGNHSITVSYGGDNESNSSTSAAITQTVNKASSASSVTSSVNPSVFGQAVTFT